MPEQIVQSNNQIEIPIIDNKKHPEFANNDAVRMKAFEQFKNKAFTKLSPEFCGYKALCEGARRYDAVVTGSRSG